MTFIKIIAFGSFALLVGALIGYYTRILVSLSKKRSLEIDIKQMLVGAKEEAQRITDEAKKKSEETLLEVKETEKTKEEEAKRTEDRLIKKEGLLDARQVEIDREVENIKVKVEEIKKIKERIDLADGERKKKLEAVSGLTTDEAKNLLIKELEIKADEDLKKANCTEAVNLK